jgi:arylsulfatase A
MKTITIASLLLVSLFYSERIYAANRPNFIVIFTDDLGYGDLGCFGSPTIQTPNLDRMAAEGLKLTSFYAQPSCTPARAALLTGRLPMRSGMFRVIFPEEDVGLPQQEITIAEALKELGYKTAAIGKWHLGHARPEYYPTAHGFDEYFGLLYSNDMIPPWVPTEVPLKLVRNQDLLKGPVDQTVLTMDYTDQAIRHIRQWKGDPFFIYLAHTMPHKPLHASKQFLNTSRRGLYGDVIQELDWNVGRLLDALKNEGLDQDTLVILTSDNGPWLSLKQHGGSAGPLRGSKGSTYEGGIRVPFIARWPGRIPAGAASSDIASVMDFLPTFVSLAGGKLPANLQLDGENITSLLLHQESMHSQRRMFYYRGSDLEAVRQGDWKLRLDAREPTAEWELYNLELDVSEAFNLAETFPEKAAEMKKLLDREREEMVPGLAYQAVSQGRDLLQGIYRPRGGVKLVVPGPGDR